MKENVVCPYCLAHCRRDFDEWLLNKRGVKQYFHLFCMKRHIQKSMEQEVEIQIKNYVKCDVANLHSKIELLTNEQNFNKIVSK